MKSLVPTGRRVRHCAEPIRSLVACTLCAVLLAGCAGTGLQNAGLAAPSWQPPEVLYQEEGDDPLGTAIEETTQAVLDDGVGIGPILWFTGAALAVAYLSGYFDEGMEAAIRTGGPSCRCSAGFRQ